MENSTKYKDFNSFFNYDPQGVISVPALVKGRLVYPIPPSIHRLQGVAEKIALAQSTGDLHCQFSVDGVHVIRQAIIDQNSKQLTGEYQFQIFAIPDPGSLIESDTALLARELYALPFSEIQNYLNALKDALCTHMQMILQVGKFNNANSALNDQTIELLFSQIPALFDAEALGEAVDRELGTCVAPGRRYLDAWVEDPQVVAHRGMTARFAEHIFATEFFNVSQSQSAKVRAVPTRQLHITSGNSPFIPLISLLRGLATKSAVVVKTAAEVAIINSIIAYAMLDVDSEHPITRHTSLVYWRGGDRQVEDVLFAEGAFDRLIVWGAPDAVTSIKSRTSNSKVIFLNPRYGLSLLDLRVATSREITTAAVKASIDSLIANQKACSASLLHYIVGNREQGLQYCQELIKVLALWDQYMPHVVPNYIQGQIRMLRRGVLLRGIWLTNGTSSYTSSAVVYMAEPFEIQLHPMSRFIIVRCIESADEILPYLNASVSAIGVYPDALIPEMRDYIAAAGVNNICALGNCERAYSGMPHDGMQILSELVNWSVN